MITAEATAKAARLAAFAYYYRNKRFKIRASDLTLDDISAIRSRTETQTPPVILNVCFICEGLISLEDIFWDNLADYLLAHDSLDIVSRVG